MEIICLVSERSSLSGEQVFRCWLDTVASQRDPIWIHGSWINIIPDGDFGVIKILACLL